MTMPVWKDRRVERPNTYNIQTNIDGTITLIPVPGTVYEPGTPLNAHNLNQINKSLDEITLLINYKVMNITSINTGTIATIPTDYKDIVVVLTIADMYKI